MQIWFYSPMEQYEIFPQLSLNFSQTQVSFYMLMAATLCVFITAPGTTVNKGAATMRQTKLVPTWWGVQNESLYRTILSMVENHIGQKSTVYFPQIYTVFYIIQFSNQLGLIPYSSTPTVELVMTQSLSITLLVGIIQLGIFTHKTRIAAAFLPAGTPMGLIPLMIILEILAYIVKILSLGQRQAINLTTGHILVKVIVGFVWVAYLNGTSVQILTIPLLLLIVFIALEVLVAYLQAFIFTFIQSLTLSDFALFPSLCSPLLIVEFIILIYT